MRISLLTVLAMFVCFAGCGKAEIAEAEQEVKKTNINLTMPPVPEFKLPKAPSGTHSVKEMRLMGNKYLDKKVRIHGYVTWVYDCAVTGGKTKIENMPSDDEEFKVWIKARRERIKKHPEECWKPHFYIGDERSTKPHLSVWITDVPRELRKDELKAATDEEKAREIPVYNMGDEVTVTGMWKLRSQLGFANSEGLLQYESLENFTAPTEEEEPK